MSPRSRRQQARHGRHETAPAITASVQRSALYPPDGKRARKKRAEEVTLTATALYNDMIWAVEDFLTAGECAAWVAYGRRAGFSASTQAATSETAFRDNGRVEVWDEAAARSMWERVQRVLPPALARGAPVACFPKIRLYEYKEGQRFGKHVDESVRFGEMETGATVLVYLGEEGLEGGETVFYDGRTDDKVVVEYRPKRGSLLLHGYVVTRCWFCGRDVRAGCAGGMCNRR